MGQVGIRLANVLLFVFSCALVANVINQVAGAMLLPDRPPALAAAVAGTVENRPWSDRQQILDRNLFDARVATIELPPQPEPEENLQETRLPLKLLGTIASNQRVAASAAIQDEKTRTHQVVQVDDTLVGHSGVSVLRIERGRVVLQNGAKLEELTLDDNIEIAVAPKPVAKPRSRRRSARSSASAKERLEALSSQEGSRNAAAIFSQARILPKYEDGQMVGIQLSKIEPDSFYEKVGLRDGDVVQELNGIKIDNPAASRELLEAFTKADVIEAVVVGPDGTSRKITADASDLGDLKSLLK